MSDASAFLGCLASVDRGPYAPEAFQFVREGLDHTATMIHGDSAQDAGMSRHVSGQQLCLGLRDYAIGQYGLLARTVLNHWGIRSTEDFGRIVYILIDLGVLSRTDEDDFDDFRSVFDFDECFASIDVG